MARERGAVPTPQDVVDFLVNWSVRSYTDRILDLGVGDGIFLFKAIRRLLELGGLKTSLGEQLYGSEIDSYTFSKFDRRVHSLNLNLPNVKLGDFFAHELPDQVDVVLGNPPYIRRSDIIGVDFIRKSVIAANPNINEKKLSRQSDLYIYFLLRGCAALQPGGRLAVVVADSWLNTGYGASLRSHLAEYFSVVALVAFDTRIFDDAEVKPVLLLAEKRKSEKADLTSFVRVHNGLSLSSYDILASSESYNPDVSVVKITSVSLQTDNTWKTGFKAFELYDRIIKYSALVSVETLGLTRIGAQTLAKEFFVIKNEVIEGKIDVEEEFLAPLASSAKDFKSAIISTTEPKHWLFYCSAAKDEIQDTNALRYIQWGEEQQVRVRGKSVTVKGFQNKERIIQARRPHWYDLKTTVERRGRAEILIPRLVYRDFKVYWNRDLYVPGELFIEFLPYKPETDVELYLAIMNSTLFEICFRVHAQLYGGGTFNMNAAAIRYVPILDARLLDRAQRIKLKTAWAVFLASEAEGRYQIDRSIAEILGFTLSESIELRMVAKSLRDLASSVKSTGTNSTDHPAISLGELS